jgi:hypothetical protein
VKGTRSKLSNSCFVTGEYVSNHRTVYVKDMERPLVNLFGGHVLAVGVVNKAHCFSLYPRTFFCRKQTFRLITVFRVDIAVNALVVLVNRP